MDMEYYEMEGNRDLARDPSTNSILNVNKLEYEHYLAKRKAKSEKNRKVQNIEDEVAMIKSDMNEIKSLLKELINGNKS